MDWLVVIFASHFPALCRRLISRAVQSRGLPRLSAVGSERPRAWLPRRAMFHQETGESLRTVHLGGDSEDGDGLSLAAFDRFSLVRLGSQPAGQHWDRPSAPVTGPASSPARQHCASAGECRGGAQVGRQRAHKSGPKKSTFRTTIRRNRRLGLITVPSDGAAVASLAKRQQNMGRPAEGASGKSWVGGAGSRSWMAVQLAEIGPWSWPISPSSRLSHDVPPHLMSDSPVFPFSSQPNPLAQEPKYPY